MEITIDSIRIKNFRKFTDEVLVEFGLGANYIVGNNESGKTSLVDAIEFCISGNIKNPDEIIPIQSLTKKPPKIVDGFVALTITNNTTDETFFVKRTYTIQLSRGNTEELETNLQFEVSQSSAQGTQNTNSIEDLFPTPALTFCLNNERQENSLALTNDDADWSHYIELVSNLAKQQANIHKVNLQPQFQNKEELSRQLINEINRLNKISSGRYIFEERNGTIINRYPDTEIADPSIPYMEKQNLKLITSIAMRSQLPIKLPMIFDSALGRIEVNMRNQILEILENQTGQIILFAVPAELHDTGVEKREVNKIVQR